jgi:multicomponent Na+:H+ antiporter subunit E
MVCICIILPSKRVSPKIIKVKCSQKSEAAKVLYANSITLTPGTVTIDVSDDVFTVHTLDKPFKESLESKKMDKKVTDIENELINVMRKKND